MENWFVGQHNLMKINVEFQISALTESIYLVLDKLPSDHIGTFIVPIHYYSFSSKHYFNKTLIVLPVPGALLEFVVVYAPSTSTVTL